MTSNPSSTTMPKPSPTLADAISNAFTSHEYNDVTGCIEVNAVDALMAIANAINRLAVVQEALAMQQQEMRAEAAQQSEMLMQAMMHDDEPGHA